MVREDELNAVLAGLVQGVLVVDRDQKLISINDAAERLLEVNPQEVLGKPIDQVIRNDDLRRVVAEALRVDDPVEGHVILPSGDAESADIRFVRVQDTTLHDTSGKQIGKMIALQDVTRLRRLEVVRRDFVANVSHEIKTPVTAIKAAIETLLDAQPIEESDALRFRQIISRQADRLAAIVEDLLTLARIEQDVEDHQVPLSLCGLSMVLDAAVDARQDQADGKSIELIKQYGEEVQVPVNRLLLEHAVVNLLDNAIKYSPESSKVRLGVKVSGRQVTVSVEDEGPGIAREHQERIFERFYRTDKARSRELGGTGLGLAIVKHVAQAHGGHADVVSQPGHGAIFRIHLSRLADR